MSDSKNNYKKNKKAKMNKQRFVAGVLAALLLISTASGLLMVVAQLYSA